jgi:hypothetical protein
MLSQNGNAILKQISVEPAVNLNEIKLIQNTSESGIFGHGYEHSVSKTTGNILTTEYVSTA